MELGEGPYAFIELSSDSESELGQRPLAGQSRPAGRPRKTDQLATIDRRLRQLSAAGDHAGTLAELEKMWAEARREGAELPPLFLKRVRLLEQLVEAAPARADGAFKLLRAKLRKILKEHAEEFEAAPAPEAEAEAEAPAEEDEKEELPERAEPQAAREEEEVDFSRRLKLSRDERRKFWQVREKVARREDERRKPGRQRRVGEKSAKEKAERFGYIALDELGLEQRLREVLQLRYQLREEDRAKALEELEYVVEKVEGLRWAEALLLLLALRLDAVGEQSFITAELTALCIEDLQDLLALSPLPATVFAWSRPAAGGDAQTSPARPTAEAVAALLSKLDAEFQLVLRLAEPRSAECAQLLRCEVDIVRLYGDARALPGLSARLQAQLAFEQLQHVFAWSTQLLRPLPFFAELFGAGGVLAAAEELLAAVEAHDDARQRAKARLYRLCCLALNEGEEEAVREGLRRVAAEVSLRADRATAAVHNRTLALLGLRLFAQGRLAAAKAVLEDLLAAESLEEALGQFDRGGRQPWEFAEPRVLFPAHLHLPLGALRTAFGLCCVLSESHRVVANQPLHPAFARFLAQRARAPAPDARDRLHRCHLALVALEAETATEEACAAWGWEQDCMAQVRSAVAAEAARVLLERVKAVSQARLPLGGCARLTGLAEASLAAWLRERIAQGALVARLEDGELIVDRPSAAAAPEGKGFEAKLSLFSEALDRIELAAAAPADARAQLLSAANQLLQTHPDRREAARSKVVA